MLKPVKWGLGGQGPGLKGTSPSWKWTQVGDQVDPFDILGLLRPTDCAGLSWAPAPQRCIQSRKRRISRSAFFPNLPKPPGLRSSQPALFGSPPGARPLAAPEQGRNLPARTASGSPRGGRPLFFLKAIKFNIYKNNPLLGSKMTGYTRNSLLLRRKT